MSPALDLIPVFVTTLSPARMVLLCVARVRQKNCQIMRFLTKASIENPLRLLRLKAIQSSRRVNHCFSLILHWCREGESNPQDPKVGGF